MGFWAATWGRPYGIILSILFILSTFLPGCVGPTYEMRPTATTPYDAQVDDLNRRLCAEIGKVYLESVRRCTTLTPAPLPGGEKDRP